MCSAEGVCAQTATERDAAARAARIKTVVVRFPSAAAGAPVPNGSSATDHTYATYRTQVEGSSTTGPYGPFASETDWEVAKWAKTCDVGSTAFSDLLGVPGVCAIYL